MKSKLEFLFFLVCFTTCNISLVAGDTIRMSVGCAGWITHYISATPEKQFTVNWGDGSPIETFIGIEPIQYLKHTYSFNGGSYKVTISGSEDCFFTHLSPERADTLDLSSCPSIKKISSTTLRHLNTKNCIHLEEIRVGNISDNGNLTILDLRDNIALKDLTCYGNQLTRIDLASDVIEYIWCWENRLPLSNLYALSEMIDEPWNKVLGRQVFVTQRIAAGDPVDFSDQKEFGGIKTVFYIDRGEGYPALPSDYHVHEGIITFYKSGYYRVIMTNDAIVSGQKPAVVVAPFNVVKIIPVSEIIDLPTTAIAGTPLILSGKVLPAEATNKNIKWSVKDAGTTGGTIKPSGIRLYTTAPGTAIVTATIKEGAGFNEDYAQDFCVEVIPPLSITEPAEETLTVCPNPTTGELRITNYELRITDIEVFDIYGRKLTSQSSLMSPETVINISHLQPGIYFVKITTEEGKIVKKVIKL